MKREFFMNFTNLENLILLRSTRPADENADRLTIGPRDMVCDVHSIQELSSLCTHLTFSKVHSLQKENRQIHR